jgi:small subunit ribosomal protein S7
MSRRHSAEKREIIPDPKFGDIVVTKFMNSIMYDGKKSAAERIVYGAFDIVENRAKANPLEVFKQALDNVAPAIEVRSRRSAAPPIRSRSRFAPSAARRWRSAG